MIDYLIVLLLFLIWAQRSEGVRRMAMWLTRKRRIFVRWVRNA